MLSKPKFSLVEKIKTIGSSYMVAAGITPGIENGERLHVIKTKGLKNFLIGFIFPFRSLESSTLQ